MPLTINGTGTLYYGESGYGSDGSHVTTKWFCLFYIPILPLSSCRVLRDRSRDKNFILYSQEGFRILDELPVQWGQVFRTYGFVLSCIMWWVLLGIAIFQIKSAVWARFFYILPFLILALAALPFVLLLYFRMKQQKTIWNQTSVQNTAGQSHRDQSPYRTSMHGRTGDFHAHRRPGYRGYGRR